MRKKKKKKKKDGILQDLAPRTSFTVGSTRKRIPGTNGKEKNLFHQSQRKNTTGGFIGADKNTKTDRPPSLGTVDRRPFRKRNSSQKKKTKPAGKRTEEDAEGFCQFSARAFVKKKKNSRGKKEGREAFSEAANHKNQTRKVFGPG